MEQANPDEDPRLQQIVKQLEANGKPKANKIRDFKSRVLSLLQLYAQHAKSHDTLFEAYEGVYKQVADHDVLKLDRILNVSLLRGANGVSLEHLNEVLQQYFGLLCTTAKSRDSQLYTETFCRLLKLKLREDPSNPLEAVTEMARDLIRKFVTKRSVKVHLNTFRVLSKRFRFLREPIREVAAEYLDNDSVRQSMKKQLQKLTKMLTRSNSEIKVE